MKRPIWYTLNTTTHQMQPVYGAGPWWAHLAYWALGHITGRAIVWEMAIQRRWLHEEPRP